MLIDTAEWLPAIEAGRLAGLDKTTTLRLGRALGIVKNFFGVNIIRRADVAALAQNRRRPGNPRWIADGEAAAADAARGSTARRRKKRDNL